MTLHQYLQAKQERLDKQWQPRVNCERCKKPVAACYCEFVLPFNSSPQFVILIHHDEIRRTVATGRMSHLCLANSRLLQGSNFTEHEEVNAILQDPSLFPVVLYPSDTAINLSTLTLTERRKVFPVDKQLVVFVIDGTWSQAKRMKRLSQNLHSLPFICFTPPRLSGFLVRRQPEEHCFSTVESIHHLIELLGEGGSTQHDSMLKAFDFMVRQQVKFGHLRKIRNKATS